MNLLSAVLSALSVGALYLLRQTTAAQPCCGRAGSLTLAVSPTFWSQAVRAEVYALNSLFVIALLALAVAVGSEDDIHAAFWPASLVFRSLRPFLCLRLGAGAPSHVAAAHSGSACAGLARLAAAAGLRHAGSRTRTMIGYLVALAAPLLLFAYIPLRAPATPYLRLPVGGGPELMLYDNSVAAFVAHVTGSVFRGGIALPTQPAQRLVMVGNLYVLQVGWAGLVAGSNRLRGVVLPPAPRWPGMLLAYVAVVVFCLVYFIGDIADLFTPAYIVVCIWVGFGIEAAADVGRTVLKRPGRIAVFALALLLACVSVVAAGRPTT